MISIIVQVNAVRLLIAEHQLTRIKATFAGCREPVVVADASQQIMFANDAFLELVHFSWKYPAQSSHVSTLFTEPVEMSTILNNMIDERRAWRGPQQLNLGEKGNLPVMVRAEVVPGRDGSILGFYLIFDDMTNVQRADAARQRLEQSLHQAGLFRHNERDYPSGSRKLVGAVLANANLAAIDILDGSATPDMEALLKEIDNSTQRATALCARLHVFNGDKN